MKRMTKVKHCAICGCQLSIKKHVYGEDSLDGRSHESKHHYVAKRLLGRSETRRNKSPRKTIFEQCPLKLEGKYGWFCYECHEELLQNLVLTPTDVERFKELVKLAGFNESQKTDSKDKIGQRIMLLHSAIEKGIKALLVAERRRRVKERRSLSYENTSPPLLC